MKLITSLFVLVLLVIIPVTPVFAQTDAELEALVDEQAIIVDFEGLRLDLEQRDQNPGNKYVRFDLTINSLIESDRIQLTWIVTGSSTPVEWNGETFDFEDPPQFTEVLNLSNGEQASRSITVLPIYRGAAKVTALVEAYEIDGTRVATATQTIASDDDGRLVGAPASQNITNILYYARLGLIVILSIVVLLIGAFVGYKTFRKWLNSD